MTKTPRAARRLDDRTQLCPPPPHPAAGLTPERTVDPRRHDLDALRAFAMLLGLSLHAAMAYTPLPGGLWSVQDPQQSRLFGPLLLAVHGFRMPLFFLVSGYFTAMLWRKKGLRPLLQQRVQRIALPLALGSCTIVPAMWGVRWLARSAGVNGPASLTVPEGPQLAAWLLQGPCFFHLWFLWFLCWLLAAFAAYAIFVDRARWRPAPRWINTPWRYAWLVPLTILPQCLMGRDHASFGPDSTSALVPTPHVLGYYAIFFFFGVLSLDCEGIGRSIGKRWRWTLPAALCAVFPVGYLLAANRAPGPLATVDPSLRHALAVVTQTLYAWLMTFGLMGLFRSLIQRENRVIRYLSDASYWLYLAHLPLVILVQTLLWSWQAPAVFKFAMVTGSTVAILLAAYQGFVRHGLIGSLLNGPPKHRQASPGALQPSPGRSKPRGRLARTHAKHGLSSQGRDGVSRRPSHVKSRP